MMGQRFQANRRQQLATTTTSNASMSRIPIEFPRLRIAHNAQGGRVSTTPEKPNLTASTSPHLQSGGELDGEAIRWLTTSQKFQEPDACLANQEAAHRRTTLGNGAETIGRAPKCLQKRDGKHGPIPWAAVRNVAKWRRTSPSRVLSISIWRQRFPFFKNLSISTD